MFGGNVGPIWPPRRNIFPFEGLDMTALAFIFTASGVVVAADGRSRWDDPATADDITRKNESKKEQKIFAAKLGGHDFAYALTGMILNKDKTFDLRADAQKALSPLKGLQLASVEAYMNEFAPQIIQALRNAKSDGRIQAYTSNPHATDAEDKRTIARILFAGYLRSQMPSFAMLRIAHDDQVLADPQIQTASPPEMNYFLGSSIVPLIFNGDPRFSKYRKNVTTNSSLADARECARLVISACSDPIALQIDPACQGIGGHIHVAKVTRTRGFEWIDKPWRPSHPAQVALSRRP